MVYKMVHPTNTRRGTVREKSIFHSILACDHIFILLDTNRVNPLYMMYRPANSVPHSTVEADLKGVFLKYCLMDAKGRLITRTISEVEQKCCTFQHWIHQWTHGNLLVTQLEGKSQRQG